MALSNLDFETAGTKTGTALGWRVRSKASAFEPYGFRTVSSPELAYPDDAISPNWLTFHAGMSANVATDPQGASVADQVVEDEYEAMHGIVCTVIEPGSEDVNDLTLLAGETYTFSIYAKKASGTYAQSNVAVGFIDSKNEFTTFISSVVFSLVDGKCVSEVTNDICTHQIESTVCANGWFRFEVGFTCSEVRYGYPAIALIDNSGNYVYSDETNGIYVCGASLYRGSLDTKESFSTVDGWLEEAYLYEIASTDAVEFVSASEVTYAFETFSREWSVDAYQSENTLLEALSAEDFDDSSWGWLGFDFDELELVEVEFDTESFDSFDVSDWRTTGTTELGYFYEGGEEAEAFAFVWSDLVVSVDPTTNLFSRTSHGLTTGEQVHVVAYESILPAGLSSQTTYYVISATANTFKLSLSSGGSEIDITSSANGEVIIRKPATLYWVGTDINSTI